MSLVIPPGFGHVVIGYSGPANPPSVTFGIEDLTAIDNVQTLLDRVVNAVNVGFAQAGGFMDATDDSYGVEIVKLLFTTLAGTPTSAEQSVIINGTIVGAADSPNSAVLVEKITNLAGRRGRGRMYMPGPAEDTSFENGALSPGAVSEWQTAATAFYDELALQDVPMSLLHSTSSLSPTPAPTPITNLTVDPLLATQRRRMR